MKKEYLKELSADNYEMIFQPMNNASTYIDNKINILNEIKKAVNGTPNIFYKEIGIELLNELREHITICPAQSLFVFGRFNYDLRDLNEKIYLAEDLATRCRHRFFTHSISDIASSFDYNQKCDYLVYEKFSSYKELRFADFTSVTNSKQKLYSVIKNTLENLQYNIKTPNSKAWFVLNLLNNIGFSGVVYTSKISRKNIYIIFDPDKTLRLLEQKLIYPHDFESFFSNESDEL